MAKAKMKKILFINTSYNLGGAAKTARILFEKAQLDSEITPYFAFGRGKGKQDKNIRKFGTSFSQLLHGGMVRLFGLDGFGSTIATNELKKWILQENFDLIHIHNLHGYYLNVFSLVDFLGKLKMPIIWTLHDEWSITRGPGFTTECEHCITGQGNCSNIYEYPKTYNKLFLNYMLQKKHKSFSNNWQPTLVCPSQWLADKIAKTPLKKLAQQIIHTGIDTNFFKPGNKTELRNKYNLPIDKKIILFTAAKLSNKTKGFRYILEAARRLKDEPYLFLGTGHGKAEVLPNIEYLGYVSEQKLADLYALCDIYLFPSLAENCPATLLEAMSAELPVVAFDIGPTREIISEKAGILVTPGYNSFVDGLSSAIKADNIIELGKQARKIVVANYNKNRFIEQHFRLYHSNLHT
jgi:putative colanic acid biosynthesis glycosyltransferase